MIVHKKKYQTKLILFSTLNPYIMIEFYPFFNASAPETISKISLVIAA